jgi:CheY-like chemotaxis protein/two-component sensor histidine kinase
MIKKPKSLEIYRPKDPILILEDNRESQIFLKGICEKSGIECDIGENGEAGLELIEKKQYSLYIVDLMMPVMDGRRFIVELKKKQPEAIIIVQTALDSPDNIIEIMKLGVFDYIIKPVDPDLFHKTIWKGFEFKYLKDMESNLTMNAGLKIRSQIEWLNYKESRRISGRDYAETKSIYILKTSLSQGAGFGTTVTLIDIMKTMLNQSDDKYLVDKQLIDLLIENNDYCRIMLEGLNDVSDTLDREFSLEDTTALELINQLPSMIEGVMPYLQNKQITVTFPDQKSNCRLKINYQKMGDIVEELLVNAYKYSVPDSKINIFSHISEGYFWLSVKNEVPENPYGGIPRKYEKLVMEPFFKLLPTDETIAKKEKFALGLGLTVVDHISRKHNGIFLIHDVKDHTGKKVKSCVVAELLLPIIAE